jgi:hypothetical protein
MSDPNSAGRIAPMEPENAPWLEQALTEIMPPEAPPLLLFRTLARNRRVFERLMAGSLLDRGILSLRERELVIDRTCALCAAWYEFDVHVAFFGSRVGLTDAQVADLRSQTVSEEHWSLRERLLLRAVEAVHHEIDIPDDLWKDLIAEMGEEGVLELLALAGYYRTIAIFVRTLRLPAEQFVDH